MIEVDELTDYLDEYLEEKQEVKNLTEETIKKQTFNISKFIEFLEFNGVEEACEFINVFMRNNPKASVLTLSQKEKSQIWYQKYVVKKYKIWYIKIEK